MVLHKQMDNFCSSLFVRAVMLVIICFGFNSCLPDSSVNTEGGKVNVAARSIPDDCVLLQQEKWVLKSYFDKYGTLEDRSFNSFKENELTPCACEAREDNPGNPLKLSGLERRLIGKGSHCRLSTSIRMDVLDGSKDQQLMDSCQVIVIDRLPAGVFADPFELQHLHELGVYGDVAVFGDTNLELPSFLSNLSAVEIHMDLGFKKASKLKRGLEINVEIPLHARYPAPGVNGYSTVQFGECDIFVHCSPTLKLRSDPCLSILMASTATKLTDGRLVWEIPSGILTHAGFISNFTFFSAAMASITIITSSLFCFRKQSCANQFRDEKMWKEQSPKGSISFASSAAGQLHE